MKRFITVLVFAIAFMLASSMTASADVVMGNEFFDKHSEKTESLGRLFQANGPDGYVTVREAPDSKQEIETLENGATIFIGSTYLHKGRYWGIPPISHSYWNPGWVPMDELLMVCDNIDFVNEHKGELYNYTGGFDMLIDAEAFYLWQWPGSDREKIHHDFGKGYFDDSAFEAGYAYIDVEGREWVYVSIWGGWSYGGLSMAGASEGWVCLDALDDGSIPAFNPAPEPIPWSPNAEPDWYGTAIAPPPVTPVKEPGMAPITIVIVIILAAIAAVLVIKFRKPKKTTP